MTAEQNFLLIEAISANRQFLLMAYRDNPQLFGTADPQIRQLLEPIPDEEAFEILLPGAE